MMEHNMFKELYKISYKTTLIITVVFIAGCGSVKKANKINPEHVNRYTFEVNLSDSVADTIKAVPVDTFSFVKKDTGIEPDPENEVQKYQRLLKEDPDNFENYHHLSRVYYNARMYKEGAELIYKLVRTNNFKKNCPAYIKGDCYYNAALCRLAMGEQTRNKNYAAAKIHYEYGLIDIRWAMKYNGNSAEYKKVETELLTGQRLNELNVVSYSKTGNSKNKQK
jgi:tetratricopeptide (TPR) repeat protein